MTWNWFFAIILVLFVGMHLFGHGGCGGHDSHQHRRPGDQQPDAEGSEHEHKPEEEPAHHGCH